MKSVVVPLLLVRQAHIAILLCGATSNTFTLRKLEFPSFQAKVKWTVNRCEVTNWAFNTRRVCAGFF